MGAVLGGGVMYEVNDEGRTKYDLHSAGRKKTWLHSLRVCVCPRYTGQALRV